MRGWRTYLVVAAVAVAGCGDSSTEPGDRVLEDELNFLRFNAEAFPLAERQGSFWAVKGENRELVLRFQADEPGELGEEFLEFEVSGNSLLRRPDGTAFARGDSVLITVQVDVSGQLIFDFQPSGLVFDPDHPAELRIRYNRVDHDLDNDGDIDSDDDELYGSIAMWRQERAGDLWTKLATARPLLQECEAEIRSFTSFALASN